MAIGHSSAPPVQLAAAQVSRGLHLWLELEEPDRLRELLGEIAKLQRHTRAALLQQGNVHFARFLPSRASTVRYPDGSSKTLGVALQVITVYDGELDAYAMDFIYTIGDVFNCILKFVRNAPPLPVKDHPGAFLQFIRRNNAVPVGNDAIPEMSLFSAYPRHSVLDILGRDKSTQVPTRAVTEEPVDFSDVQANILWGVRHACCRHLGLHITEPTLARRFFDRLHSGADGTPAITPAAAAWGAAQTTCLNLGLTYRGLTALGLSEDEHATLRNHFQAFVEGPEHFRRARRNGDMFSSHPDTWVVGGTNHTVDLVLSILGKDIGQLDALQADLCRSWSQCALELVFAQHAAALPDKQVHFGYRDGISQPALAIQNLPGHARSTTNPQPAASAGSVLLGAAYTNGYDGKGSLGGLPETWATNATFAALRMMRQDVAGFELLLDEVATRYGHMAGVTREWIAARMMGRWRDGTPMSLSADPAAKAPNATDSDDFDYAPGTAQSGSWDDADGARCPIGSHIRRMNPRSSRVAGMPHTRRLIRRGMPYGPLYDPKQPDDAERGLVGLFFCADLERQFEFLLHTWANADAFASGLAGTQDPIMGAQAPTGLAPMSEQFRCLAPDGRTELVWQLPRMVHTRGGLYLFMPGLAGLRYLANGTMPKAAAASAPAPTASAAIAGAAADTAFDPARFDPRDRSFLRDPYPTYARAHCSLQPALARIDSMDSVWVFGHELITEVCRQTDVYFKREDPRIGPAGLLTMDNPAHRQVHDGIAPLFGQAIANARHDAATISSELLARMGRGTVDWVRQFARPLSQRLFARVLAVDEADIAELLLRVELALSAHNPRGTPNSSREFAQAIKVVGNWFTASGDRTSGSSSQQQPLLQELAKLPHHDPQANANALEEFAANAGCLALAGFKPLEWSTGLISFHLLKDNGRLLDELKQRKRDNRLDYTAVICELMRYDTPLPMANRYARVDAELGGMALKAGARLTLVYGAGNHDPKPFGNTAGHIDFDRDLAGTVSLGFGHGARECLGYALAQAVLQPVIETLMALPGAPRLASGYEPAYGGNPYFRFLHHLPIES